MAVIRVKSAHPRGALIEESAFDPAIHERFELPVELMTEEERRQAGIAVEQAAPAPEPAPEVDRPKQSLGAVSRKQRNTGGG